jgi:hypothetical protein
LGPKRHLSWRTVKPMKKNFLLTPKNSARLDLFRDSGSVLIYVIVAVAIASMVAISYLVITNNHREETGRTVSQQSEEIQLELATVAAKRAIENVIQNTDVATGKIDFGRISNELNTQISNVAISKQSQIRLSTDGDSPIRFSDLALMPPDALKDPDPEKSPIPSGDPFFNAKAIRLPILMKGDLKDKPDLSTSSLDKQVTVTPQMELRGLPMSEFTMYSKSQASVELREGATYIGPDGSLGRVYTEGELDVQMPITTNYPLIARGINTNSVGELTYQGPVTGELNDQGETIVFDSGRSTSSGDWYNESRTKYDSKIVTTELFNVTAAPPGYISHPSTTPSAYNISQIPQQIVNQKTVYVISRAVRDSKTQAISIQQIKGDEVIKVSEKSAPDSNLAIYLINQKDAQGNRVYLVFNYLQFNVAVPGVTMLYLGVEGDQDILDKTTVVILNAKKLNAPLTSWLYRR